MKTAVALLLAVPFAEAQPRFEKDILPIFTANCFACHGGRSMVGLDLRTAASAIRGSSQGPVLIKGDSAKSLLFQKVSSKAMPPEAFNLKLTPRDIETIRQWIDAGCPSDEAEAAAERWDADQLRRDHGVIDGGESHEKLEG